MSTSTRLLLALTVFCFLASACAPIGTALPATPVAVSTATQTPQPIPTLTLTQPPTDPPATPTTSPTQTITPLPTTPTAECPKENPSTKLKIQIPTTSEVDGFDVDGVIDAISGFLSNGGSFSQVISLLRNSGRNEYRYEDITGDRIRELSMVLGYGSLNRFYIFYCSNGSVKTFVENGYGTDGSIEIKAIRDLNRNGFPEIVIGYGGCSGSGCLEYVIDEWDGNIFLNIAMDKDNGQWPSVLGPKNFEIKDTNGDGLEDLILTGDRPGSCCEADMIPWRYMIVVYSWNGMFYKQSYKTFETPQYRFQAVQDADKEIPL